MFFCFFAFGNLFIYILFVRFSDITIELRALGVPWTLHCWMHALSAAHELRLDSVIDQLLQDFLQVCPDDYSSQFVTECLPLLFNIFRYSKVSLNASIYVYKHAVYIFISIAFVLLNLAERRNHIIISRYICYMFWLGTNQID